MKTISKTEIMLALSLSAIKLLEIIVYGIYHKAVLSLGLTENIYISLKCHLKYERQKIKRLI